MERDRVRTRVIGVGSPLMRDDGFGPRVVAALRSCRFPKGVEAIDAGVGGLALIGLLEGAERVLLIDVVRMGMPAGTLRLFPLRGGGAPPPAPLSLHESRVRPVLNLAAALGVLPPVFVLGVEPETVEAGLGLSLAVEAAVPEAVRLVSGFVGGMRAATCDSFCGGAGWAPRS